jgi:hypothetical protein
MLSKIYGDRLPGTVRTFTSMGTVRQSNLHILKQVPFVSNNNIDSLVSTIRSCHAANYNFSQPKTPSTTYHEPKRSHQCWRKSCRCYISWGKVTLPMPEAVLWCILFSDGNPWPKECGVYIEQFDFHFGEISWMYLYYSCSTPEWLIHQDVQIRLTYSPHGRRCTNCVPVIYLPKSYLSS